MQHPSGKVSFGGLVLLALVAGVIYLGVMIVPFYVDNLDVKEAVAVAHNQLVQGADDFELRNTILDRTSRMGTHWERDQFDRDILVPGLGLTEDQIIIERSSVTPNVRIQVDYTRRVRFKPTNIVHTLHFRVVKDGIPGQ
ncbi:hypothetical protein [Vitiosangium sp. GDMCC 1.1324]|uniref:hypothetical protein n=1 Tax=Vitiosangium sp. (strain GDMCC 1.1324) TaxID=2138576 RepID=UPI0011B6CA15|nr:hypothetical protein [Vitiosangium sp. GDMCC 1.1324]